MKNLRCGVNLVFKLLALLLCGLCTSVSKTNARSLDDVTESGFVKVAIYENYAPFSYKDENGQPAGIDVDIAQEIAKGLGVKLELLWMSPGETTDDDLRNYIWKGHIIHRVKADLMMRAPYDAVYSQKRDDVGLLVHELVHMFAPYHSETWQIVHHAERLPEVPTMSMFSYHPIGVENDSIPYFYLNSAFGGRFRSNTTHYVSNEEAFSVMQAGKIDAVMGLRSQMTHLHSKLDPEIYKLAENAFPLIGKQKWDIGMAVHNDFRALGYAVGDVITEMVLTGKMAEVFAKYGTHYEQPEYYNQE